MKKIVSLSLTLALAGAVGGAVATNLHPGNNCEECSALQIEQSTINRNLLLGDGFAVMRKNGEFKVVPKKPINLNVVNDNNINGPNYQYNNYNNGTINSNMANNNSATSPYGVGNANSGVLPNNTNNPAVNQNVQTTNVDSMVRTNTIDTYKNNVNNNIDGVSYDNNGKQITRNGYGTNNGFTTNYVSPTTRNTNSNTNATNNRNVTQNNLQNTNNTTRTSNLNNTTTDNNRSQTNTQTSSLNQNQSTQTRNTQTNTLSNPAKANDNTQSSSIDALQSQLKTKKDEFNKRIDSINNILNGIDAKTITLENEQAIKMNEYLNLIEKLSFKLVRSHSLIAFDLDTFWNKATFDKTDTTSAYYLEIKNQLGSRIICFDCLNEALDQVASILQNYSNTQNNVKDYNSKTETSSYSTQTKTE